MMDIEGFRRAGYAAVDQICDYYASLQRNENPVAAQVEPGFLSKLIPSEAPQHGEDWSVIEQDYKTKIMPGITHWQAPNFMAYYPCNATFEGGLADLHAAMISNPGFNWTCSPSVTELEIITLDWVAKMLGLSDDFLSTSPSGLGGGIILGSASEVCVTMAIGARERALRVLAEEHPPPQTDSTDGAAAGPSNAAKASKPDEELDPEVTVSKQVDGNGNAPRAPAARVAASATVLANSALSKWRGNLTSRLVMYGTTQTHSIAAKAAIILGLDFRALEVTKEDGFALRGATLRAALLEDQSVGRVPFMLVASLGTTSSGAVDNVQEITEVARDFPSLWVHVDAAYAGVALALPELREQCYSDALCHVDSFSTNLHKWGLVQFDCSPLFLRDRGVLSSALTVTPEYLRTRQGDAGSVLDMRNMQIPLGRRFRSLKIWFVLRSYGVQGFQEHIRRGIKCADVFAGLMGEDERFEMVAPPNFALRVFRLTSADAAGGEDVDALNRRFWDMLQTRNSELLLTQTVLPDVGFCIRLVPGSTLCREEHMRAAWKVVKECADKTLGVQ